MGILMVRMMIVSEDYLALGTQLAIWRLINKTSALHDRKIRRTAHELLLPCPVSSFHLNYGVLCI